MERQSRRQFVQGLGAAGLGLVAGCGRLPERAPRSQRRYGARAVLARIVRAGVGSPSGG
jgi:hypothetical protein